MNKVRVELEERSYDILIGSDPEWGASVAGDGGGAAMIVTDTNVGPLYAEETRRRLEALGLATQTSVVPAGETSKDLSVLKGLYSEAVKAGLDRRSIVIALGGGMVGDLAGFMAATFLRGLRYIQIPTTILAMVDSSVGGKTAVNLPEGKNLVGAFYQPVEVVSNLDTLKTLPDREYISGLAEVVKYGVIWDAVLFRRIEETADALLAREPSVLEEVVTRCCEIKAEIVAMDEKESGVRAILNFGHTLGHAVENLAGYGELLHGEAVAIGMLYAVEISRRERGLADEDCSRVEGLMDRLGLTRQVLPALSWEAVREAMSADKKSMGRAPRFVLAEKIGAVVFGCELAEDVLEQTYAHFSPPVYPEYPG